jgi:hypothetical protein
MNPDTLRAFARYNTGIKISRAAYHEDLLAAQGLCIRNCGRRTGYARTCVACRKAQERGRGR